MTDSWWLKVKRAQKHMVDIRREARRYAKRHPYEFTRVPQPKSKQRIEFSVRITEPPDPVLALMLGDFVHNLRSGLDHVIVASVPKKYRSNAGFPIVYADPFAKDADGEFVVKDTDVRNKFDDSIRGLDPRARALVILAQPYWLGDRAETWVYGIINRLDNADKHRELATFGAGVASIIADVSGNNLRGRIKHTLLTGHSFAEKGTVIGWQLPAGRRPSKVDVQCSGTAVIQIKVSGLKGGKESPSDYPLYATMLSAIQGVRRLLRILEHFVVK